MIKFTIENFTLKAFLTRNNMSYTLIITYMTIFVVLSNGYPFEKRHILESTRIIGGVDAPEGFAPHMAALVWGESLKSMMCGGSIVTAKHILTAAHCIDPLLIDGEFIPSFRAVVGSNQWAADDTIAKISHHVNHPHWDPVNMKNDIGVLYLTEELELNDRVAVIPLSYEHINGVVDCYVTGWGQVGVRIEDDVVILAPIPDDLQLLHLKTTSHRSCVKRLREVFPDYISLPPVDPEIEICAFHSYGHGMCSGDSGSALVSTVTGHQIAIVSWGYLCANGAPDVFARISAYKDFLSASLK